MMVFEFPKNFSKSIGQISKVNIIAWSPNNMRIALGLVDNNLYLFKEERINKEIFSEIFLGSKYYEIISIQFNKENTKFPIALNINLIYSKIRIKFW